MAFWQPLTFANANIPEWHWHAPPFMAHWAEDLHHHKPFQAAHKRHVTTPAFDIRETGKAYFLDGEFPGASIKDDIRMHWVGKRTLVVEATISRVDLEMEWGIVLPKAEEEDHSTAPEDHGGEGDSHGSTSRGKGVEEDTGEDLSLHHCLTNDEHEDDHNGSDQKPHTTKDADMHESRRHPTVRRPSLAPLKKRLSFGGAKVRRPSPQPLVLHTWASERATGALRRAFAFPEDVDHGSLEARLSQGVLKVMVAKVEPMEPKAVSIDFFAADESFAK